MSERKGTKALELWCKRLIRDCPDIQIENMTTSWRDGMAFCALVHHFRPDLIDMSRLKRENIYENNHLAFSVAEKHLGIPALLDPEDMVENDVPDRLSILTYLSQFYQRLGHTVTNKTTENASKTTKTETTMPPSAPIKFGKTGLDKCTACGLPVYLAQRLMVSQKLYHRRCFRCSKCSGHLNPKNYHIIEGSEFSCDSCKNDKTLLKYLNNNDHDQMGMVAFGDNVPDVKVNISTDEVLSPKQKTRPTSILDKINMFEKNTNTDKVMDIKVANISLKDNINNSYKDLSSTSGMQSETDSKQVPDNINRKNIDKVDSLLHKDTDTKKEQDKIDENSLVNESSLHKSIPEKVYKSNIEKFNFLQTQLSDESIGMNNTVETETKDETKLFKINNPNKTNDDGEKQKEIIESVVDEIKEECNITDDIRIKSELAKLSTDSLVNNDNEPSEELNKRNLEAKITVPPRRKKQNVSEKKTDTAQDIPKQAKKEYPDHLNPFSDDEEEESTDLSRKNSTNPFGSSDEEDKDDVPPIHPPPKVPGPETSTPVKRLIAVNPFWSDGEEPSSDEDDAPNKSSKSSYSSMATSTPNLVSGTPRRLKPKAPPPPVITVTESSRSHATSMDDVASISSLSSYNSTFNSEQRTPTMRKKISAPTPPDNLSTVSETEGGSLGKGTDSSDFRNASGSECGKRAKGPAPGLPLPERREVKLQMSPEELQVQLDLLETQQLGLERQGVLIERMIRDKCEGDEACTAPQEEVEDLVIQLCELVNEKNDLFRKQTELMYIRRQQRLEQEQADIEHEIRVIQSRPAVNRIDADKAREEHLVSRLVEIVRLRDELVQQLDAERRRERQEDLAIAASIATKRAQRNSDTSLKSAEVPTTHKKKNVKDKVKKQLKKAKHSLYSKKKEDKEEKEKPK